MARRSWIFICAVIFLLVMMGLILFVMWYIQSRVELVNQQLTGKEEVPVEVIEEINELSETVPVTEVSTFPLRTGKITNILLVGQDGREGEEAQLADTILLCSLDHDAKKMTVLSFMRDLYVRIPVYDGRGGDMNRINTTYAFGFSRAGTAGGMEVISRCIEENFGVNVDGVVVVGFDTFVKAVEAVGGIEVELDDAEAAYLNRNTENEFTAGVNLLNSWDVLTYARMRHSGPRDSDFTRTGRQRKILTSLVHSCKDMNILELDDVLKTVLPLITTNLSTGEIISLGLQLLPMMNQLELESMQCPAEGTYRGETVDIYGTKAGVLIPDLEKNRQLLQKIAAA